MPDEVRRTVRWLTLDTIATTLAANTLGIGIPELLLWARAAGGTPEATIMGFSEKLPAATAAMVNGGMAHALNFDDTTAVGSGHLGPVTLPPALAAAEVRSGATGRDLAVAVAAGAELMSRIGLALSVGETFTESKPQPTQMPGYFASAMSASRMFGFSSEEIRSSLGLAFMQASGGRQPVLEGRPAKAIYAAFPCHGGMLSAILTRHGLRGDCDAFEGEAGFFPTYYGNRFNRSTMVDELGERWSLLNVGLKPWPTTGVAHVFIQAAMNLRDRHRIDPGNVAHVLLRGEPHIRTFCEPLQTRRNPQAPVEAEDSIIFSSARALVSGNVSLADLQPTATGLFDQAVVKIANLTEYEIDESLGKSGIVQVTLASGEVLSGRVDRPPGHRDNPLTDTQRHQKLYACAEHAGTTLNRDDVDQIIDMVERLDQLDDVRVLLRRLGGK